MYKFFMPICALFLLGGQLFAQGYKITFELSNYSNDTLMIGYPMGDKQYVQDTLIREGSKFVLEGAEPHQAGMYLAIMKEGEKMDYFQFLIDNDEQNFAIKGDAKDVLKSVSIKNSVNNQVFFDYLNFLNTQRTRVEELKAQKESNDANTAVIEEQLDAIDKEVADYQNNIVNTHMPKLVAAILRASQEIPAPDIQGDDEIAKEKQYRYYKEHWFDNIDLGDDRLLRTPVLYGKVEHYVEKMLVPSPDSIIEEIDMILGKMNKDGDNFRFFLPHFLNKYAASKYVGMDAVYVHIAKNYYGKGYATWTDKDQLDKILENANTLEPILINKVAPDINAQLIDVEETLKRKDNPDERKRFATKGYKSLHEIDKKYTVLFVWDPDCGVCKKSTPVIVDFYEKHKDKVEVYAICNKTYKDIPECAEYIKEKMPVTWINTIDPFLTSGYKQNFDVRSTPQIFVLDKDKRIISKKISAEQLTDVIERFEKIEAEEKKNGK